MSFFSNLSTLFAAEQAKQKSDQKKAQVKEQKQEQSQVKKPSQVSKVKVKESLSQLSLKSNSNLMKKLRLMLKASFVMLAQRLEKLLLRLKTKS